MVVVRALVERLVLELVTGVRTTAEIKRALLGHARPLAHFFGRRCEGSWGRGKGGGEGTEKAGGLADLELRALLHCCLEPLASLQGLTAGHPARHTPTLNS
jgi:hypothetical protein